MSELPGNAKIVVIGASAGGLESIKILVTYLPADFAYPVFIVWHVSPDARGVFPELINKLGALPAAYAVDKEPIRPGQAAFK